MNRKERRAALKQHEKLGGARAPDPRLADAQIRLGDRHYDEGRLDQAAECYVKAIELAPNELDGHNKLCAVLLAQRQFDAVASHFEQILTLKSDYAPGWNTLAVAYLGAGNSGGALDALQRALKIADLPESKNLFMLCLQGIQHIAPSSETRGLILRAMTEPWGRPGDIAGHCINLVKSNPAIAGCIERAAAAWPQRLPADQLFGPSGLAAMARDKVLRCLLENARVTDLGLEQCLTNARAALLDTASTDHAPDDEILAFHCSLARQCFINEYVFVHTVAEEARIGGRRESLSEALRTDAPIVARQIAAIATYMPLHRLPDSDALLRRTWPQPVEDLLTQQIRNPAEEVRLRDSIPQLTAIDDSVSRAVQRQYEENPYPQWVKAAPASRPTSINARLRGQFPFSNFRNLGKDLVDVLVAGCGTGQQLVDVAQRIAGARVLAIDLSMPSLSYARRQLEGLGLHDIEYGQADILKLGELHRRFDIVDCGGVLHHLGDPLAGWRVLVSLLRRDGLMRVALYSELARRHIVAARDLVAKRGYERDAAGIRQFRQDVIALPDGDLVKLVGKSPDFFSVSDCRDLVFHVQEHRFTLPRIKEFLAASDLEFLGFELDLSGLNKYGARFPEDRARTDLDRWDAFEQANPWTFGGMYQFWVQKRPSA